MTNRIFSAVMAAVCLCALFSGCAQDGQAAANAKRPQTVDSKELQFQGPAEGDSIATISTSMGDICVVLYPQYAPMAVENFIELAQQDYFNGILFHRVIPGFVVQSGDGTGTGSGGTSIWNNNPFPTEITDKLHHYSGALSMAHPTNDSDGNLSQFYIVQTAADSVDKNLANTLKDAGVREEVVSTYRAAGGAPYLDNLNTVFGQVYDGMEVVDAIAAVKCDENDRPLEDVTIHTVTIGVYTASAASVSSAA